MLVGGAPKESNLIKAIYQFIEEEGMKEVPRDYIGASSIGDDCELKLWLGYRHPRLRKKRNAKLILSANDGHHGEKLMASYLRRIPGIRIETHTETGNQFAFTDLDNKYGGHPDGFIIGIPQAPKTTHIWENKVKNHKHYIKLENLRLKVPEKSLLEEWDMVNYCQGVVYMDYFGITRHYMTVGIAGSREWQDMRTNENKNLARLLREKAERISKYPSSPNGISDNPSFYKCKLCDFSDACPSINKHIKL